VARPRPSRRMKAGCCSRFGSPASSCSCPDERGAVPSRRSARSSWRPGLRNCPWGSWSSAVGMLRSLPTTAGTRSMAWWRRARGRWQTSPLRRQSWCATSVRRGPSAGPSSRTSSSTPMASRSRRRSEPGMSPCRPRSGGIRGSRLRIPTSCESAWMRHSSWSSTTSCSRREPFGRSPATLTFEARRSSAAARSIRCSWAQGAPRCSTSPGSSCSSISTRPSTSSSSTRHPAPCASNRGRPGRMRSGWRRRGIPPACGFSSPASRSVCGRAGSGGKAWTTGASGGYHPAAAFAQ
jgi:hypothetical protein